MTARPVVVIDEDDEWCAQVCRLLEAHGYHVISARSEAAALRILAEIKDPSVIFIEPRSVGDSFCRRLRDLPQLNGVPLFLISAAPARDVYERSGACANGYVRKAVALDHLPFLLGHPPDGDASHRRAA